MLVDPASGRLTAVSGAALATHREHGNDEPSQDVAADGDSQQDPRIEHELYLQQIETATRPVSTLEDLASELRRTRAALSRAADSAGARVLSAGTPVLPGGDHHVTPHSRYRLIVEEFGEVGRAACVCGMHLHVDVADEDEGVRVLDYLRAWLPVLRAISANSPFWLGRDTGYASWRSQVWSRWPTSGPAEPYGSVAGYRAATKRLITARAALDSGMLYLDARLSERYPTVEIRVADVCTETDDILLIAGLARALVETAASDDGRIETPQRSDALRSAHWRASRYGMADRLMSPVTQDLEQARAVVEAAIRVSRNALDAYGDTERVADALERLLARGSGAGRQRAVAEATGSLEEVVADLERRFTATWEGIVT